MATFTDDIKKISERDFSFLQLDSKLAISKNRSYRHDYLITGKSCKFERNTEIFFFRSKAKYHLNGSSKCAIMLVKDIVDFDSFKHQLQILQAVEHHMVILCEWNHMIWD